MAWLYYLCLFVVLLAGLALTVMTLPGLWLMLAAAAIYAWATHGAYIGMWTLVVLLTLAATAEWIEVTSSGAGAKRAGGGRAGLWGALIGGILGGVFLSVIPIPVISTLIGVCLGTFLGAMIGEFAGGRHIAHSALIGIGAARGRLFGTFIKLGFGCVMLVITMGIGFPYGGSRPLPAPIAGTAKLPPPATGPTTR